MGDARVRFGYGRGVLRALFLLLSLLMATPAAAMPACHDAPMAQAHAMAGQHHHKPEVAPPHACLGCIPPSDWLAAPLPVPAMAPVMTPHPRITTLDLSRAPPPLLRPPRLG
jgi:hypothetical protein